MTTDGTGSAASPDAPDALFSRYRETGDAAALGRVFDATAADLFRVAMSLTPDAATAEDAVQETFLAAIAFAARWDPSRPVVPWLVGILRHKVEGLRRAAARGARAVRPPRDLPSLDPAGVASLREDAERVRAAMDALPEPYRQAALLRWRHGLEPAEIAHLTGDSPGAIRVRLHRAMERLRERIRGGAALALLAGAPRDVRGLGVVRSVVVRRAGTVGRATATAAAVAGGVLMGKKAIIAAMGIVALLAGTGVWIVSQTRDADALRTGDVAVTPTVGTREAPPRARPASDDAGAGLADGTSPQAASGAAFTGRVLDEKGAPVAGVEIVATAWRASDEAGAVPPSSAAARTGADGTFDVRLPEGTERADLAATRAGYATAAADRVRPGVPVELRLEREGVLRGRVLDLRGRPIAGAAMRVFRVLGAEHVATEEVVSAADGSYRIGGFGRARRADGPPAPVRYQFLDVRATCFGAMQDFLGASPGPGEEVVRDVYLVAARQFTVRVVDGEGGAPVAGATVTAGWAATGLQVNDTDDGGRVLPHPAPWIAEGVTDADGACRLDGVPAQFPMVRHLVVRVWAPGFTAEALRVTGRRDEGEEPAVVTVWPAATLTGRVIDEDGAPVRGASIGVWAARAGSFFPPGWFPVPFGEVEWYGVRTDADGRYTYRGVRATRAGDQPCRVTASLPYRPDAEGRAYGFGANVTVEVAPIRGEATVVPDIVVEPAEPTPSATFVVVDGDDRPVAHALVRATGSLTQTARTDDAGRAALRWPSRVVAGLTQAGGEFAHVLADGFARAVVTVKPDLAAPPEVRVVLGRGASVTGRVVEADGSAVPGATVYLSHGESGAAFGESMRSGPDGTFAFERLPVVEMSAYAGVGTRDRGDGRGTPSRTVRPGDPPLTLVLSPDSTQRGAVEATVVADESDERLVGASVVVECDPQPRSAVPYDVRPGSFEIEAVPVGTWAVGATARVAFRLRRGTPVIVDVTLPKEGHTGPVSSWATRVDAEPGVPGAGAEPYLAHGDDGVLRGDALRPGRYRFRMGGQSGWGTRSPGWVATAAIDVPASVESVRVQVDLVRAGTLGVQVSDPAAPEAPKSRSAPTVGWIDVVDSHGERHAMHLGAARGSGARFDLLPGSYVVRLHLPGQPTRETPATVLAGEETSAEFGAPK